MKKSGRKLVERPGILWDIQTEPIEMSRLILLQLTERAQHEIGAFLIERADRFPDRDSQELVLKSIGDTDYELQSLNLILGLQILANKDFEIVPDWTTSNDGTFKVSIALDPTNNFRYLLHLQHPAGLQVGTDLKFRRKPAPTPPLIDPYKLQISLNGGTTWSDTLFDLSDLPLYRFNPLDVVRGDTNEVVGEWAIASDSTSDKNLIQENWRLTLDPGALGGTPGADAPPMEIIHTYTLSPGADSYIELATEAQQIEFMGGVSDGSTIPYVAGFARGADAKTIRVIHTFRQEVNAGNFFRPATGPEIAAYATEEEALDETLTLYTVGIERGVPGTDGIDGIDATPITDTVANKLEACADPTLTFASGVLTAGFPVYCPPEPPDPPGEDSDAKKCNVAQGIGGFVNDLFTDYLNYIDAQIATFSTPLTMANAVLSAIPGIGTAINFLVSSVTAIFSAGVSVITAQFDSLTRAEIQCILYCILDEDGKITQEVWDAFIAACESQLSEPLAGAYTSFLKALDLSKLTARAFIFSQIEAVCDFCDDCENPYDWEIIFETRDNQYSGILTGSGVAWTGAPNGWSTRPNNGVYGQIFAYLKGVGSDTVIKNVVLLNGTNKTTDTTEGDSAVAFWWDIGAGGHFADALWNFSSGVRSFDVDVPLSSAGFSQVHWDAYIGDYPDHTQYVDFIRWTIRGTGTRPIVQGE